MPTSLRETEWVRILASVLPVLLISTSSQATLGQMSASCVAMCTAEVEGYKPQLDEQQAEMIEIVKQESLQESLRNLEKPMWYYMTRLEEGIVALHPPLEETAGYVDHARIKNNRRFRRVLEELSTLPAKEAGALVANELRDAFNAYRDQYDAEWDKVMKAVAALPGEAVPDTVGPSMVISDGPVDGPPLLAGLRLKVLALTLVVASLELADTRPVVEEVVNYALQQRDGAYAVTGKLQSDAIVMLVRAGIYDRSILSSAVVALTPEYDGVRTDLAFTAQEGRYRAARPAMKAAHAWWSSEARPKHEVAWEAYQLVPHNAIAFTWSPSGDPVDWSLGPGATVRCLPQEMDDATFEAILARAGWKKG